jgi:hypothetical protein
MMIEGRPAASRRSVVGIAVAALVGATLGVGVLSYVRTMKRPRPPIAAIDATPSAGVSATSTVAMTTSASAPTTATSASENVTATPAVQGRVRLRITPSTAIVLVDGVVLPRGTDTIAKPQVGASMSVLVRADKHDDTMVLIDSASPDEVEVTLTPSTRQGSGSGNGTGSGTATTTAGKGTGSLAPATAGTTAAPTAPSARPPRPAPAPAKDNGVPSVIDAPPNPYD